MYLSTQGGQETTAFLSWMVTAALYPLLTIKVRRQLSGTEFAIGNAEANHLRSLYRGVIPFLLMNLAFSWTLRPLFNK